MPRRWAWKKELSLSALPLEFSYKNDDLGDPFINSYYALALGLATQEEIDDITRYAFKVNDVLREYFDSLNIELIDFKIEFGRCHGKIILADEISPDTCRLWDKDTHEKLDKDRFRRDLGGVEDAYEEVFRRAEDSVKFINSEKGRLRAPLKRFMMIPGARSAEQSGIRNGKSEERITTFMMQMDFDLAGDKLRGGVRCFRHLRF